LESLANAFDLQFGVGARTCIGKNISLLEMTKLLPQLVQKFGFVPVDEPAFWTILSNAMPY
jgi:cytochrome P450